MWALGNKYSHIVSDFLGEKKWNTTDLELHLVPPLFLISLLPPPPGVTCPNLSLYLSHQDLGTMLGTRILEPEQLGGNIGSATWLWHTITLSGAEGSSSANWKYEEYHHLCMLFGGLNRLLFTKHLGQWVLKNWCLLSVVLEKTLERPLDCKEIKLVNLKENQPWIFTGRTDAEAEAPIFWPLDAKGRLVWKDPEAWKDWRQEKGMTEDEMVGWHHRLNDLSLGKLREIAKNREAWRVAVHGVAKNQTRLSDWATTG